MWFMMMFLFVHLLFELTASNILLIDDCGLDCKFWIEYKTVYTAIPWQ